MKIKKLKKIARSFGIGPALLYLHQWVSTPLPLRFQLARTKNKFLSRIMEAKPVAAGTGKIEVHMLLNHRRIYEGLWSLYSFVYFSGTTCSITIHDDGTLTRSDTLLFHKLFPGSQIIPRSQADTVISEFFRKEKLERCLQLRRTLKFALKLFDPFFFLKNPLFILLDSDVLFFSRPESLIHDFEKAESGRPSFNLYSQDNGYRYCLDPAEMERLAGRKCLEKLNPGVLFVHRNALDFHRIESHLSHQKFWTEDGVNYYAELTLWALELTVNGAVPLPDSYAICPAPDRSGLVSGHYCGGGYPSSLFYTQGLPLLASKFLP